MGMRTIVLNSINNSGALTCGIAGVEKQIGLKINELKVTSSITHKKTLLINEIAVRLNPQDLKSELHTKVAKENGVKVDTLILSPNYTRLMQEYCRDVVNDLVKEIIANHEIRHDRALTIILELIKQQSPK